MAATTEPARVPEPRRPSLSGYVSHHKLLPWSWVDGRMARARNYWITTHSTGFPSARPVWGLWHGVRLLFSTGSLIGRHIEADSRVQVNLESADELVIIEGQARCMPAEDLAYWRSAFREKYHWDMPDTTDGVFEVQPVRVLAWVCDPSGADGGALFSNTATEWRFDAGP